MTERGGAGDAPEPEAPEDGAEEAVETEPTPSAEVTQLLPAIMAAAEDAVRAKDAEAEADEAAAKSAEAATTANVAKPPARLPVQPPAELADEAAAKSAEAATTAKVAKPPARLPVQPPAEPADDAKAEPLVPPLPPDDTPTVVDMIPAFAIVDTDATTRLDAVTANYRGSRRRGGWTKYPVGAIAVAVVILLITLTVAMQLFRGSDPKPAGAGEPLFRAQTPAPPVGTFSPGVPAASPTGPANPPGPTYVGAASPVGPVAPGGPRTSGPAASPSPSRLSPSPTLTPPTQAKTGAIVGGSGKCAEVTYYGQVQLDTCNGGSAQRWTLQTDGTIRAMGACLDVRNSATAAGTVVQLFECNRTAAQQWRWRTDGTLLNPNANRCLDAENGNSSNGTRLIIWDCHGRQNQVWRLA